MKADFTTTLLPVAYFPPVSYFNALLHFDKIVVEQHETYPKQTYRNRCKIMTANGKLSLTIPMNKPFGNSTKTNEVQIFYGEKWQLIHKRTIESAYLASPYYLYFKDELEIVFHQQHQKLLDLNMSILSTLMELIGIEKKIELNPAYVHHPVDMLDLRQVIHPKKPFDGKFFPAYTQVFSDRHGFQPDLSILDLLFNLGPETYPYLESMKIDFDQLL
jgi:hypothetical protein